MVYRGDEAAEYTDKTMKTEHTGLQVRMFSAFSMEFDGQPVNIMRGSGTKVLQLFAMLLMNAEKELPKKELLSNIYGQSQGADPNRNLNNLLYRLKKQLVQWGMDGANVVMEGGFCRLETDFPVTVDALVFQQKAEKALTMEDSGRQTLLEEALEIYTGDFLEEYGTELWVIHRAQELKRLYFQAVSALGGDYVKSGNLYRAREVYHNAALLFPFESWQLSEMDCLIELKDYDDAYAVYQNTERLYDEELGIMPGQEYRKRLDVIEKNSMQPARRLSDIADMLRGKDSGGAYYCYYPDFLDSCQILSRIAERTGQSIFLLLCTWSMRGSKPGAEKDQLEKQQMEILRETISRVFRKGDIFTKYSRCQYLVILCGTGRENGVKAFGRLQRVWKEREDTVGELSYSIDSLLGFRET